MKRTLLCGSCKAQKLEDDFYLSKGKPQKNRCKPCARKYAKDRLKDPKKLARKQELEKKAYIKNKSSVLLERKQKVNSSLPHRVSVIIQNSRGRAKRKGLEFNLSKQNLLDLYESQNGKCALSGEPLEICGDRYLSNLISLDRIDSSKGYIEGNVQWVGVKYNMMKAHADLEEFIEMCRKVVEVHDA